MDSGALELCCMPRDQSDSDINGDGKWRRWQQLPRSPFTRLDVTSYAVHSDGETILFSTNGDNGSATFAFDTRRFLWTRLGEWSLPFAGRGHFDSGLHALVGLDSENLGYLFACDVPSTNRRCPVPAWKRSKKKVFRESPADRHVGATLVYMGCRRNFCLVECVSVEVKENNADQMLLEKPGGVPQRSRYMYRLMTFTLKYDKMDNLRVKHGRVQYYKVPKKATTDFVCADPVAFWL
ncbi:hypothetical protein HU200_025316 [Digitaria exilis]|uniref:Uncharacterized protein n=1 Tax=Digitaria exilis TaxID=1010633 RepID=A0A835EWA2_9POAL|nr:hypothetical protein HU200_025316 [Digitaria exilis]